MDIVQILSLNDKQVIKILTKKYNYDKKEIGNLRKSSMEIRLNILSKYFDELKDVQIGDLSVESTSSRSAEKK